MLTGFIAANSDAQGSLETFARNAVADFLIGLSNITNGVYIVTRAISDFGNKVIEFINEIITGLNSIELFGLSLETIDHRFGALSLTVDSYTNTLVAMAEAVREGVNSQSAFNNELDKTPSIFERIAEAMKLAVQQIPEIDQLITNFTRGAMDTFTNAFTDAVTGAKNFADAVKDMARSVINSLIKMLVQYYITKPLFDAITGFVGGLGGGGTSTGGSTGNYLLGAPKAVGGPVSSGRPYIVGENGPELFVPSAGGQVVPNGRMGGGGSVNQTINITTGVAQTVRAEILNLMPQIAESAKAAVADSRMRGGSYSKALMGM
jgi:phage-related minor tail protein